MPHWPLRPRLVIVALLALCDYLLWNWSLSANHDLLALVSGMTLIPLLLALVWLLVLAGGHLLAGVAQRSRARHAGASQPRGWRRRQRDSRRHDRLGGRCERQERRWTGLSTRRR